jgi:hypothetical protein
MNPLLKHCTKRLLSLLLLLAVAAGTEAQTIQFGNGYVNVNKRRSGGKVETNDTLEIRMSIHIPWGFNSANGSRVYRVRYLDSLPSNTTMLTASADSLYTITNEGRVYKKFTLANDADAGTYDPTPTGGRYHIKINLGKNGTSPSNNTIVNSNGAGDINVNGTYPYGDAPKWWTGHLFSVAYRVRVTGAVGDSVVLGAGKFVYRLTSNGPDIVVNSNRYKILITNKDTMCLNGLDISLVDSVGSTFQAGNTLNRSTGPSFAIPGYVYRNNVSASVSIGDGSYAIVNNLSPRASTNRNARNVRNCTTPSPVAANDSCNNRMFDGHWYIDGDHTGTSNAAGNLPVANGARGGYMMVVNADYVTTEAFRDTVTNLCPDTYYEFSAWLRNICPTCGNDSLLNSYTPRRPGVFPNLTFVMDGKDLYSSGELDTLGWQNKGFLFRTNSTQTTSTFSIRNNAQGGGGNDWAIDDIKVSACIPRLTMNFTPYVMGCKEQSSIEVRLSCVVRYSYNGSYIHFKWQRSTNNGLTWTNVAGTTGVGSATQVAGMWQYTTNYNFWASGADSGHRYRVVVATSASNLSGGACAFNDGTFTYLRFVTCASILPTQIVSFTGALQNGSALLHWQSEHEQDFSHYVVEKSTDGQRFTPIGTVQGLNNGNRASYQFTDAEKLLGTAWYRLKLVDKNGLFVYSNIIVLSHTPIDFSFVPPPNPFAESIALRYTVPANGQFTARLFDPVGRLVRQQQFLANRGVNNHQLTGLDALAAGVYHLQVQYQNQTYSTKLVKQR